MYVAPLKKLAYGVYGYPSIKDTVISVRFGRTSNLTLNVANTIKVQLSDKNGSFASPLELGSVATQLTASGKLVSGVTYYPGSLDVTLLASTLAIGYGYRIRVVSTDPVNIGITGGENIAILSEGTVGEEKIIEKFEPESFVYPNPTDGLLYLKSENKINYSVIDIAGSEVATGSAESGSAINLQSLPTGIYFVVSEENGKVKASKIIRK